MRTPIMETRVHTATLISRWLLVAGLLAVSASTRAAGTVDAAAIMRRVLANRPAFGLWLEAELRIERKTSESYDINIFVNGEPRQGRTAYRVTAPDEAAGTAVLMIEGGDCWLCSKGRSEPRRITPAERAMPFLGSDFAYEDLELAFLRWPNHSFVRESRRLGFDCWVIESAPGADTLSQYGRVLSWVDKQYMAVVITEAYDTKGKLLKNFEVKSVRKLDDRHYVVGQIALSNVQSKSRTVLRVLEDHKMTLQPEIFWPETFCNATATPPRRR